jgi:hypothetical protein
MLKNQKLGLVAIAFLAAGFGTWYLTSYEPTPAQAAPVALTNVKTPEQRTARQKELTITEIPESQKKVEHAIADRWEHLGEEVLTAPSVDKDGGNIYYDKEVHAGLTGDGKVVYAQGFHRVYLFKGPVIRESKYEPVKVNIKTKKKPGSGFLAQALLSGGLMDRGKAPTPKVPVSDQ